MFLILALPEYQQRAAQLSEKLSVPYFTVIDFARQTLKQWSAQTTTALLVGEELSLQAFEHPLPKPVRVDWADKSFIWRLQHGGGRGEMLAKACGIKGDFIPTVVDATAGFGRDSVLLASLGCQVTMLERSPLVQELLADGWRRAQQESALHTLLPRLQLLNTDALAWLQRVEEEDRPDVVYLDPMFPSREKSAKVKVNMQVFHQVVGADMDADALLAPALAIAKRRVVVKRPRLAPPLADRDPDWVFSGESSRFDVYGLT